MLTYTHDVFLTLLNLLQSHYITLIVFQQNLTEAISDELHPHLFI